MPIANQKYAFITEKGWEGLSDRWPDAPVYGGYKLLVFAGESLTRLEEEFNKVEFRYLGAEGTVLAIEGEEAGPFICTLEEVREVVDYFKPEDEEV